MVAKPYDAAGMKANVFEVLELSPTGTLTRPGRTFTMGRAAFGVVAFTPDGQVGMVAQEMGTVGVFRIDAAGAVTVVEAAFAGEFYASSVVADPTARTRGSSTATRARTAAACTGSRSRLAGVR